MTFVAYLYSSEPERSLLIVVDDENENQDENEKEQARTKLFKDPRNPEITTEISPSELASHFRTCIFIFAIQMTLALFCYYNLGVVASLAVDNKAKNNNQDREDDVQFLVSRFIGAVVLHLQIEAEVLQAIHFLKIAIYKV